MVRVYHESLGQDLVPAEESLSSGVLVVRSPEHDVSLQIPIDQLEIEKGGANNQLFILKSPLQPGWVIYVRDYDLIKQLRAEAPGLKAPRKNLLDTGFSLAVAAAVVFLALVVGAFMAKDPLVAYLASKVPKEYEAKLGKTVINQLVGADSGRYEPARKKLEELLSPLAEIAKTEGYELKVYISSDESLNAFALPGGYIAFNLGFLKAVESAEEILGVGGHELAHVTKRHSLNQLLQTIGTYALLQIFFGDFTGLAGVLVDNSQLFLSRMHSRESETEADLEGLNYLYSKNISGIGLLKFMQRLKEEMEKQSPEAQALQETMSFLSTHPATEDRLKYLKDEIVAREAALDKSALPVDFNMNEFKALLEDGSEGEADGDR